MVQRPHSHRLCFIVGTRPEAIKLAPVVRALPSDTAPRIVCTGQHPTLARDTLAEFGLTPDICLAPDPDTAPRTMTQRTVRLARRLCEVLSDGAPPAAVLVQGDTLSALAGAIAGVALSSPVAHVEAGLRTGTLADPWPEERNRRCIARLASLHFAPTARAVQHLRDEGIDDDRIVMTGNTGIDALRQMQAAAQPPALPGLDPGAPMILATAHRRNGVAGHHRALAAALNRLAHDANVVFIRHMNAAISAPIQSMLTHRICVLPPQRFLAFLGLMNAAHAVVTDSGGVQEEASALGLPAVIIRDLTERPESRRTGAVLVDAQPDRIEALVRQALRAPADRTPSDIFGDGRAAARIVERLHAFLTTPMPAPAQPVAVALTG